MDTIFIMAFAIILLNTDLHTPNLKPEKRMKAEDFIRNLRGIDEGVDPDPVMLNGIYERIKAQEFKPGSDHVTQVFWKNYNALFFNNWKGTLLLIFVGYKALITYT